MAHGRSRSVIEIEGKEIILLLCWYLFMFFLMTKGQMKRPPLSYVADVMPFSWSWCQYSVLVTQCQRTLKRKLSLYLCVMLSVISQLRPRISLHSLIMLLIPPLWCVHFFSSSYCAQGKSIKKQSHSQL